MNVPRKHHYVPRFYLKGFTQQFSEDDSFWVCNLEKRKAWKSTPANSAIEGDFYRCDLGADTDPMWLEHALGDELEPVMGEVLAFVLETKIVPPCGFAFSTFVNLVATSLVRGTTMRDFNSRAFNDGMQQLVNDALTTHQGRELRQLLSDYSMSSEDLRALHADGKIRFNLDRATHIKALLEQVDLAIKVFEQRHWEVREVKDGVADLVCSDIPVFIAPLVWRDPNALVVFPLNRRNVAYGLLKDVQLPSALDSLDVAIINSAVANEASFVYSSSPEFLFLKDGKPVLVELSQTKH